MGLSDTEIDVLRSAYEVLAADADLHRDDAICMRNHNAALAFKRTADESAARRDTLGAWVDEAIRGRALVGNPYKPGRSPS